MGNQKQVAEKKVSFLPTSKIPGFREGVEKKVCPCCGKHADGAIVCDEVVISPFNSMCYYSGKAEKAMADMML